MPSSLTPKSPTLLRVSESQAISNSSSFISSASSSYRNSESSTSSGYLTNLSSPFTPSSTKFGNGEGDRRYHHVSDLEDTFDAVTALRNRLERAVPTVATRRALEIMDSGVHPNGKGAPFKVVITGPDSPVDDWSSDFELGGSNDIKVCPEPSADLNTTVAQLRTPESDDWPNTSEVAASHSSVLFPSASDRSLFDEIDRDFVLSLMPPKFSVDFPSKPVLEPVISGTPCSPFILGTPDLSANWQCSTSSFSTLMAESPVSHISSPANLSFDEEELSRIMRNLISLPTRRRQHFLGSPESDMDVATAMHVEIASTIRTNRLHPHAGQTGTLVGLGVAMPVIYPPLPPSLFPFHQSSGATLNPRSLQELGYPLFDDKMFEIEQTSSALLSRNVNHPSPYENVESGLDFEINESHFYSPLQDCTAPTPLLPEVDFECKDVSQVEQSLPSTHTPISQIVFGKVLVRLGLQEVDDSIEASVESQPPPTSDTQMYSHILAWRSNLVSVDGSVAEGEVALPPVSDFFLQAQKSLNLQPSDVQKKVIQLDASQLERQSALYNLEHSDLVLDHIFSHPPPLRLEKRAEMERQLLANLFKKKLPKSRRRTHDPSYSTFAQTNKVVGIQQSVLSRSCHVLKRLGLERLAIFQPRLGRDDLDLTSPTVTLRDDPRSPILSTLEPVFLPFTSLNPSSPPPVKDQSSGSMLSTHPKSEVSSDAPKDMQIGLGLPSVALRRRLRQEEMSSQGSVEAILCHSRSPSQEYPSVIVTQPSFSPSCISTQSVESSNQFLKPSKFTRRSLSNAIEVPTPPSPTCSPPRETPPVMVRSTNVDLFPEEVPMSRSASARLGFKKFISNLKLTFKRSRSFENKFARAH